jgi:hypothetical protein
MKLFDSIFLLRKESEEGQNLYCMHTELMDHINSTFRDDILNKDETAFFVYGNGRSNFDAVAGTGADLSKVVERFCELIIDHVTELRDDSVSDPDDPCIELRLAISTNEEHDFGGIRIKLRAFGPIVWELDEIPQGPDYTWGKYGKPTNVGKLLKKGKKCNSKRTRG